MRMAWQIEYRKGVWLPQVSWWLDGQTRAPRSFVTHAHSDHIARHAEVACSAATARLLRARLPGRRRETILEFGATREIEFGVRATLHPAGHVLGSSLVQLETEHGTLLYTGDFKLRPGLAAERCATPPADVLVMETTFGLPKYVFPPDAEVIAAMTGFCRQALAEGCTPVLLCYSLGKTQEVLQALAPAGLPVMLHDQALFITDIYGQLGMEFPSYRGFDQRELGGHVVICPPHAPSLLQRIPAARTAVVTGWAIDPSARFRYRCDAAFPLSDHAVFPDLLRFVELVRPKRILTLHGHAREFAATLRSRGWDAWAVGQPNQTEFALASPD
jgi:Cft2 family RNA processing exonuclease